VERGSRRVYTTTRIYRRRDGRVIGIKSLVLSKEEEGLLDGVARERGRGGIEEKARSKEAKK
jgi:hypothetical protein